MHVLKRADARTCPSYSQIHRKAIRTLTTLYSTSSINKKKLFIALPVSVKKNAIYPIFVSILSQDLSVTHLTEPNACLNSRTNSRWLSAHTQSVSTRQEFKLLWFLVPQYVVYNKSQKNESKLPGMLSSVMPQRSLRSERPLFPLHSGMPKISSRIRTRHLDNAGQYVPFKLWDHLQT